MMSRWLLALLVCSALSACELVADFDRGKLTPPTVDSGVTGPDIDDAGDDAGTEKTAD